MRNLILVCLGWIITIPVAGAQDGTRMLHEPDISADRIVFVYAGDRVRGGGERQDGPGPGVLSPGGRR